MALKPTDGFYLAGWMRTELDLKGAELMTYALVHQFSQSSAGIYKGGVNYLSSWLGCSYRSAFTYLKNLVQKGYINEITGKENGVPYCHYTANIAGDMQNFQGGYAEVADRIIDKNISINTLSNKGRSRFEKPSVEEIREYCKEKGLDIDAEQFFNFYESKGWMVGKSPMKNWKAAIATWAGRKEKERQTRTPRPQPQKKESVFERNMRNMDIMFGTNYHEQMYGKKEAEYDEQ